MAVTANGSLGAAPGDIYHRQTPFRYNGTSLHPLQRVGAVPAQFHDLAPYAHSAPGLIGVQQHVPPASTADLTTRPPLVPIMGGPHDPSYMV